jgi:glycerol-3-phosphate acyltransferase PlsX
MLRLSMTELAARGIHGAPEALAPVKKSIDYAEYGGALLLGITGIVIIGHGRSDEHAVANAIGLAARALDANINEHIVRGLENPANSEALRG